MNNQMFLQATLETVTPSIAESWLKLNASTQRNVSQRRVENYARDMRSGRWQVNGETLVFDDGGRLIDGQHRLRAVVVAGVPVSMLVVRGVGAKSYKTIDQGQARSLPTVLNENGETSTTARSLATYAICGSLATVVSCGGKLTTSEVDEWFRANKTDVKRIATMIRRIRKSLGHASTIALAAPLYALGLRGVDLDAFVDDLCTAYTPRASARACVWAKAMATTGGSGRAARVATAKLLLWLGECFERGLEPEKNASSHINLSRFDLIEVEAKEPYTWGARHES